MTSNLLTVLQIVLALSLAVWVLLFGRIVRARRRVAILDGKPPLSDGPFPRVSILVPARNEEGELPACLDSLLRLDYPDYEVVLVDDGSTDGTLRIAEEKAAEHPRLRVIRGRPCPRGWIGKSWAVWQAAEAATGSWLLLTDADVWHERTSLRRAMGEAQRARADALSVLIRLRMESLWERLMLPLFSVILVLHWRVDRANDPSRPEALMIGGYILVRRGLYDRSGGHRVVRSEILEDMALSQLWKASGARLLTLWTQDLVQTRMYDSFRDLWTGLSRHAYPGLRYSPGRLAWAMMAALYFVWLPYAAALGSPFGILFGSQAAGWLLTWVLAALCVALQSATFRPVTRAFGLHPAHAFNAPLSTVLYVIIAVRSAWNHHFGAGIRWKDRSYARDTHGPDSQAAAVDSDSAGVLS